VTCARPGVSPAVAGMALAAVAAVLLGSSAGAARVFTDETGTAGVVIAFAGAVIAAPLLLAPGPPRIGLAAVPRGGTGRPGRPASSCPGSS
jgi:hypothetical protein